MNTEYLISVYIRYLDHLKKEIEAYPDEASLWHIKHGISNSAGNLALHLIGNLNHFIGAKLDNTGYIRNRDAEFSQKDVSRANLLTDIEKTKGVVKTTLQSLSAESLTAVYPEQFRGEDIRTLDFILHLLAHLAYHVGQVNYHRRLLAHEH